MKIGTFAKKNKLSIDTIRYYQRLNLIHPVQMGRNFDFSEVNQAELDFIQKMKALQFSLSEIKEIIYLKNVDSIHVEGRNMRLKQIFLDKSSQITQEIALLQEIQRNLNYETNNIETLWNKVPTTLGLPLSFIPFLICPHCKKQLNFDTAKIIDNKIANAIATCTCSFILRVVEGIISTNLEMVPILNPLPQNTRTVDNFIDDSPPSFIDYMFKSIRCITSEVSHLATSETIILDIKSSIGLQSQHIAATGCSFKYLILVDEDIQKLKLAQATLTKHYPDKEFIFICCDLNQMPLKDHCIDIAIDFLASFIDGFRHSNNIYSDLLSILTENSSVVGLYLYFKQFSLLNRLPEHIRPNFDGRTTFKLLLDAGFTLDNPLEEKVLEEGSNLIDFFKPGDTVTTSLRHYCRRRK